MGKAVDTRWQLKVTRLGILAFKIAIVVILILALITPLTGGVKVNVPSLANSVWSFDNGTLNLKTTVGVYNGGIFDVNDFSIKLAVADANSTLTSSSSDHVNIRSGQWSYLNMPMAIDLGKMNQTALRSFVFNATKVTMAVDVGATYPLGWVSFNIGGNSTSDWQPLVQSYSVDVNRTNLVQTGGQYSLSIPYNLSVSNMISGAPVDLKLTVRNDTGTLATTSQRVVLKPDTSGHLVLNLTAQAAQYLQSHEELLHFDAQVGFLNATATKTYDLDWRPPISGLGLGRPELSLSPLALLVPFHFNTSAPVTGRTITLASTMTVNGQVAGSGTVVQIAQATNSENMQIPVSTSTIAYLGANPATLGFTLNATAGGLTETQNIMYQWSP